MHEAIRGRNLIRFESNHNPAVESPYDLFALSPAGMDTDEAEALAKQVVTATKEAESSDEDFDEADFSAELQKRAEKAGFLWIGNCMGSVNQGD